MREYRERTLWSLSSTRRSLIHDQAMALLTRTTSCLWVATACAMVPLTGAGAQASKPAPPASGNPVVSSVQLQRENVFDSTERSMWLARAANGLHMLTREHVVQRELLIREGERYDSAAAAETARNLRKLEIFRDVTVDSVMTSAGLVQQVTTRDSWTTQPYVSFKSSGEQITWGVGIKEKNLLGRQIQANIRYTDDPDRSTLQLSGLFPRIWRNRVGVDGSWEQLSDGKRANLNVSAPFTSLSTREMVALNTRYKNADVLRFYEGDEEARDTVRHLLSAGMLSAGWATVASARGYVRVGGAMQFRREDFTEGLPEDADRSVYGEVGVVAETSRSEFRVVRAYRGIGAPEDIDLSQTLRVGVWVAPSAWGYERTGVGPMLTAFLGKGFSKGFATAEVRASSLFTREGLDSGSVTGRGVLALLPAPRHTVVLNADIGLQKNSYPGAEFDLGFTFGPRGFPAHAFTGDRAYFTTAEYRWIVIPNLFKLFGLGIAAFADHGGAWYSGSPRRTGTDVGMGLRFGSTRTASSKPATRIDLAHRFANDVLEDKWVIAIGAGFPFERVK